jgi:large subunit ribosomal protein L21
MYAIIQHDGKQIKVREGQELDLDYRDLHAGDAITFEQVVALSNGTDLTLGKPTIGGAKVTGTVVGVVQGPKLVVQKLRRRKNSRRRTGHRQMHTRVQIEKIEA